MNHSRSYSGMRRDRRALRRLARLAPARLRRAGCRKRVVERVACRRGLSSARAYVGVAAGGAAPGRRRRAVRARAPRRAPLRRAASPCSSIACSMRCACAAACSTMLPPAISWKRANRWLFFAKSAWPSTCAVTSVFSASVLRVDQIGVARIAGEHHFEDPRVPHALAHQLVDVAHAERPVRHAHRQAVDRDLGHEAARARARNRPGSSRGRALRERLDAPAVVVQASLIRSDTLMSSSRVPAAPGRIARIAFQTSSCDARARHAERQRRRA